jgi:hypothetical protein
MKAIQTTFHGPTDTRGSRITATAGSNRVTLSYDHALDADENHDAAALALCEKLGWNQHHLMRGTLENARHQSIGNVYTFEANDNRVRIPAAMRETVKA